MNLINLTDEQIATAYGARINAGDAGVTNAGGDLLIDFGAVGLGGGTHISGAMRCIELKTRLGRARIYERGSVGSHAAGFPCLRRLRRA